uniref:Uncharacterized protein n=1 Tax=Arundo donax TaxID=35708 RepID=A0A0A8YUU0_ARUDO
MSPFPKYLIAEISHLQVLMFATIPIS